MVNDLRKILFLVTLIFASSGLNMELQAMSDSSLKGSVSQYLTQLDNPAKYDPKRFRDNLLRSAGEDLHYVALRVAHFGETIEDPEINRNCRETLKSLFRLHCKEQKMFAVGAKWFWFLEITEEGEIKTWPIVQTLDPTSVAARAGLQVGDIVRSVNGQPIVSGSGLYDLPTVLRALPEGKEVKLSVTSSRVTRTIAGNIKPEHKITFKCPPVSPELEEDNLAQYKVWLTDLLATKLPE